MNFVIDHKDDVYIVAGARAGAAPYPCRVAVLLPPYRTLTRAPPPSPPPPPPPGPGPSERTDAAAAAAAEKAAAAAAAKEAAAGEAKVADAPMTEAQRAKAEGKVRCRNYGCNKWFKEDENEEGSCAHHTMPPLFHETRKGWSCCKDRPGGLAYDWDAFMAIRGCATGKHSTVAPDQVFAASPTLAMAERANAAPMKSAADFEAENPDPTPADVAAAKPRPKPRADGKARCVNGGCQQEYVVAENNDSACHYHKGQAVFHDRGKTWSCCPDRKAWTWEDFMAVTPCTTGPHRDWIPPEGSA